MGVYLAGNYLSPEKKTVNEGVKMVGTMQTRVEKLEKEAERLTPKDLLELVDRLVHRLREEGLAEKELLDWRELYGLGKGLWTGEDAQEYVNRLREDRI
jgi:hypothetical protein